MIEINHRFFDRIPPAVPVILIILLSILCWMSFIPQVHQWGDTSTYYMQIQSIAEDHDIQYRPNDIERAVESRFDNLPMGLFLIKTEEGEYFYGKEYSYALFAAPFYKVFGNNGILLFNALMFYAMILMGYLYLRRNNGDLTALGVSTVFFFMSTAFVYNFWIHAEIYNMFLIMSGLFLWTTYFSNNDRRYLILASLIFGITFVAKIPNIVLFIPIALYELYEHRFKNFILMILAFSIVAFAFYGYFYFETGSPSFYGGCRLQYASNYPFLNGYDNVNEAGVPAFSVTEGRIGGLINTDNLKTIPYNIFYYFFGRFTGILWYYPLAIFSLASVLAMFKGIEDAKTDTKRTLILIGIILYILFFVIIIGNNYLGGCHAVGNRYFYVYPAFLFLLGTIKYRRLMLFIIVAMITVTPIIANPIWNSERPDMHTLIVPYRYFPVEYSQLSNLPLWAVAQRGEIYPVYVIQTGKGNEDHLIKTDSAVGSFDLLLWSYYEDNLIKLKSNHYSDQLTLDEYDAKILTTNNISPEYSDRRGVVYKLSINSNKDVETKLVDEDSWISDKELHYGPGWHGEEDWGGTPTRWMRNNATLFAYSDENRTTVELDLTVLSYRCPRTLEIYLNGHPWTSRSDIPTANFVKVRAPSITLRNGTNIITFYVPEGCESPYDMTEGNSMDTRCLSLAFQEIELAKDILINDLESSFTSLGDGWHGLEDWDGTPTRWMENDGMVIIESEENRTAELSFKVRSYNHQRNLEVYDSEENLIGEAIIISEDFMQVEMPVNLEVGNSSIRLHVPEVCESPHIVTEGKSPDTRCLSLTFQEIKIN